MISPYRSCIKLKKMNMFKFLWLVNAISSSPLSPLSYQKINITLIPVQLTSQIPFFFSIPIVMSLVCAKNPRVKSIAMTPTLLPFPKNWWNFVRVRMGIAFREQVYFIVELMVKRETLALLERRKDMSSTSAFHHSKNIGTKGCRLHSVRKTRKKEKRLNLSPRIFSIRSLPRIPQKVLQEQISL